MELLSVKDIGQKTGDKLKIGTIGNVHLKQKSLSVESASAQPTWQGVTKGLEDIMSKSSNPSSNVSGKSLADMLHLQVQMNKLHMRVELCSKVAESASATVKKLQQAQ